MSIADGAALVRKGDDFEAKLILIPAPPPLDSSLPADEDNPGGLRCTILEHHTQGPQRVDWGRGGVCSRDCTPVSDREDAGVCSCTAVCRCLHGSARLSMPVSWQHITPTQQMGMLQTLPVVKWHTKYPLVQMRNINK